MRKKNPIGQGKHDMVALLTETRDAQHRQRILVFSQARKNTPDLSMKLNR